MPLHALSWNGIFVVQCINMPTLNLCVCVVGSHETCATMSYLQCGNCMELCNKWTKYVYMVYYVYGERTMTSNVQCVRWDDGKWMPHQAKWRHLWPSFGPYSCYDEKYESKSFYNDIRWWYEGCISNFMSMPCNFYVEMTTSCSNRGPNSLDTT